MVFMKKITTNRYKQYPGCNENFQKVIIFVISAFVQSLREGRSGGRL